MAGDLASSFDEGLCALPAEALLGPSGVALQTGAKWLYFVSRATDDEVVAAGNSALCSIHERSDCSYSRSPQNDTAIMLAFNHAVRADVTRLRQAANQPRRETKNSPKPDMPLSTLLCEWSKDRKPRPQTVHEVTGHVEDLIDFLGHDQQIGGITRTDLYDYRDEAANLPPSMPRSHRTLPFCERVAKNQQDGAAGSDYGEQCGDRVSPTTLKKRMGSIAAVLGFATEKLWLDANVAHNVPIASLKKGKSDRRSFRRDELKELFACPFFFGQSQWRYDNAVSDCTLAWLFLLGLTTGARLEEMGSPLLAVSSMTRG